MKFKHIFCLSVFSALVDLHSCQQTSCGKLIELPKSRRCRNLSLFFSKRPPCDRSPKRKQRCCDAAKEFVDQNCRCYEGVTDGTVDFVKQILNRCKSPSWLESDISLSSLTAPDITVFVGVLSAAKNHARRKAIRATWATDPRLYRVVFFIARPARDDMFDKIRREAVDHNDIVILSHIYESYDNITYQTFEVCRAAAIDGRATHVLKVDDDSYVRVERLLEAVVGMPREKAFMGYIENPGGGPHRNTDSQWYVSEQEWPSSRYPPWAHGAGYVLTMDIVREIATGVPHRLLTDKLFKLEDVSMGSWVEFIAENKNWDVQLIWNNKFNFAGCNGGDIVSHYITAPQQLCMWKQRGYCCFGRRFKRSREGE